MGRKKRLFQDSETMLRRFGNDNKNAVISGKLQAQSEAGGEDMPE
jgi:hypothetical protein